MGGDGKNSFKYDVYRCTQCGLVFMHPEPDIETTKNFYPKDYGPYLSKGPLLLWKFKVAASCFSGWGSPKTIVDLARRFVGNGSEIVLGRRVPYSMAVPLFMPKNAAILEIGCGSGSWLLAMRALGYANLFGIDIDASAKKQLEEANIRVLIGDITDLDFSSNSFNLIRLEHVLEHLPKPKERLGLIARWLKPSGYIVMNGPNVQTLTFKYFGRYTDALALPIHIYHYSPKTIDILAPQCGLRVLEYRTIPVWKHFTRSWQTSRENIFTNLLNHKLACVAAPLYARVIPKNKSDFLTAIITKR